MLSASQTARMASQFYASSSGRFTPEPLRQHGRRSTGLGAPAPEVTAPSPIRAAAGGHRRRQQRRRPLPGELGGHGGRGGAASELAGGGGEGGLEVEAPRSADARLAQVRSASKLQLLYDVRFMFTCMVVERRPPCSINTWMPPCKVQHDQQPYLRSLIVNKVITCDPHPAELLTSRSLSSPDAAETVWAGAMLGVPWQKPSAQSSVMTATCFTRPDRSGSRPACALAQGLQTGLQTGLRAWTTAAKPGAAACPCMPRQTSEKPLAVLR